MSLTYQLSFVREHRIMNRYLHRSSYTETAYLALHGVDCRQTTHSLVPEHLEPLWVRERPCQLGPGGGAISRCTSNLALCPGAPFHQQPCSPAS